MTKHRFQEISASVYAWDLYDEGVEKVLDELQNRANVNSVYLVGLMHKERHPWPEYTEFLHNPNRKEYQTEDSVAFWQTNPYNYGRIVPKTASDFLKDKDWLELLVKEAKKRKMKVGVEFSHTLLDDVRLRGELSDICQKNIWGKPLEKTHIGERHRVPCLNHSDFAEYAENLAKEITENYDIDYVMNCIMPFPMPAPYLLTEYEEEFHPLDWCREAPVLSGCFCEACEEKARSLGYDLKNIARELLAMRELLPDMKSTNISETEILMENPALHQWLEFKRQSVTEFHRRFGHGVKSKKYNVESRLNLYITSHPEYAGIFGHDLGKLYESVRVCCYLEHMKVQNLAEKKQRILKKAQRSFGENVKMLSTIAVLPGSTQERIIQGIRSSWECGFHSLALGHYDSASYEMLDAVGKIAEI